MRVDPRALLALLPAAFLLSPVAAILPAEASDLTRLEATTPGARIAEALGKGAQAAGAGPTEPLGCSSLGAALASHARRLDLPVPATPMLDPRTSRALGCLLGALAEANDAHDALVRGVPKDVVFRLYESDGEPSLADLAWLAGRDARPALRAAIHLAHAIDDALPILIEQPHSSGLDLAPILRFEPEGAQTYTANYALTVDLAGDDTYDNHAGGVFLAAGNAFFDVEPGSASLGTTVAGQNVAVGGGVQDADFAFSAGLVLDLSGDDTYGVKRPPTLADALHGCGLEPRVPYVGTIGAGILGVGMLLDLAGNNTYVGRTQSQGAGHVFGVGALYSGTGRDRYEAIRGAQGSGLLGGHGVLIDAGGDDEYVLAAPEGGVFNGDRRFCDADARYGQGGNFDRKDGPFTPAVGILLDLEGDDTYRSPHKSQGFSQGHGFGLLLDVDGDDRYESGALAQGAGFGRAIEFDPQAIWGGGAGLLVDRDGNDLYTATSQAQGWALGPGTDGAPGPTSDLETILLWSVRRNEALGLQFDAGGTDTYGVPGRADGTLGTDGTLGIHVDLG